MPLFPSALRRIRLVCCTVALILVADAGPARAEIITFDDLPPGQGSDYVGIDVGGRYYTGDPAGVGLNTTTFTSGGVSFTNRYDKDFNFFTGFSYSNVEDAVSPGFTNQYAASTGSGMGPGRDNYGVTFGWDDLVPNSFDPIPFDPMNVAHLASLPSFGLPVGMAAVGMYVTNTTYAALAMRDGDFVSKKFGGLTGLDPDWFKLTAYGIGQDGSAMTESVEFYLADYRNENGVPDYILADWTWMDLTPLAGAQSLHFNLSSSDVGMFGMNTPGGFAMDNLEIQGVPEPTSLAFVSLAGVAVAVGRYRRARRTPRKTA